jgi:serine/threonine-protein kinase
MEEGRQTIEGVAHRYVVLRHLGAGGMGSTSEVYDLKSGPLRRFAIKIMDPELARRDSMAKKHFVHEARATMALQHPNIVTVYFLDELPDGTPLYAMELLNGKSVASLVSDLGQIHPLIAVNLIIDALDGLHEAHKHSLTHQDFKPSNIMTHQEKKLGLVAKVIDFGVVRMQDDCDRGFAGTFAYAAPEQARGENIGPWTDVFGAGAALFEMLTGQRPFVGVPNSASGLLSRMDRRPPSILDSGEFDRELAGTIAAALSPTPGERPQTAKAFASLLRIIALRLDKPNAKETEKISMAASPILRAQLEEFTEHRRMASREFRQNGAAAPVLAGVSATMAAPLVQGGVETREEGANRGAAAIAPTVAAGPARAQEGAAFAPTLEVAPGPRFEAPAVSQMVTEPPSQFEAHEPNVKPVYVDAGTAKVNMTVPMAPVTPSRTVVMDVSPSSPGLAPVRTAPKSRSNVVPIVFAACAVLALVAGFFVVRAIRMRSLHEALPADAVPSSVPEPAPNASTPSTPTAAASPAPAVTPSTAPSASTAPSGAPPGKPHAPRRPTTPQGNLPGWDGQ